MTDDEPAFDEWLRVLTEDVVMGEYGYERGEFTVFRDHWRPAFDRGETPLEAFDRSLLAAEERREERMRRDTAGR